MAVNIKEKTQELWEGWKKDPSNKNLKTLLDDLTPIIYRQTSKWGGVLSPEYMESTAKKLAVSAIKDFDPGRGAVLSTHVTNRLQKISRPVYMYQNVYRLSEPNTLKINTLHKGKMELEEELGRPPTMEELAHKLGWSISFLRHFQEEMRGELVGSEPVPVTESGEGDNTLIHYVYHELNPQQKQIFEHLTGFGGAEVLSLAQIQKKFSLTPGQLSHQKRILTKKFEAVNANG